MKSNSLLANEITASHMEMRQAKNKPLEYSITGGFLVVGLVIIFFHYCLSALTSRQFRVFRHRYDFPFFLIFLVIAGLLLATIPSTHAATLVTRSSLTPTPTIAITPTPTIDTPQPVVFTGYVSNYSRSGCLGCSSNFTTASGEPLSDTDLTLAFNRLPLGSIVRVTNTRNGQSVIARVNDTGGFEKYGRIADLGEGVRSSIDSRTDSDIIKIELIK